MTRAADRATSTRYDRPHRPAPVALANRLGRALEALGFPAVRADLEPDGLLRAARARTDLEDLGDPTLPGRLARLAGALDAEAALHPLGRWMARENLIRLLVNRLRMEDDFRRHPGIGAEEIRRPLFVIGLQRTGTTVMHRLLAADPGRRWLASWEAVNPAPMPRSWWSRLGGGDEPRLGAARTAERVVRWMAPDFFAVHPIEAAAPEEDCLLFDVGFWGTVPEATMRVPSFSRWLEAQEHLEAYRFYRRVLQYLQWQRGAGASWVLKTPQHLEHLDTLLAVFPDARFVQTHRDPARVLPSFWSMIAHGRGVFSDDVDPREIGRHWFAKAVRSIERSAAVRAGHEDRFLDVGYADLLQDPLREVARVYELLGEELPPAAAAAMRAWCGENPQHRHGRHRYRLEDFGIDRREIDAAFADYRRRHAIPDEREGSR